MVAKNNQNDNLPAEMADRGLFRKAMDDMGIQSDPRNQSEARYIPHEAVPKTAIKIRPRELTETNPSELIDKTQGDYLEFARDGLQRRVVQRLKQGEYAIAQTLDLHGCTTAEAEPRLFRFLSRALNYGDECVSIIHGKGLHSIESGSILKQFTTDYLRKQSVVKAFCSAQPRHGGTGAVYVLLQSQKF